MSAVRFDLVEQVGRDVEGGGWYFRIVADNGQTLAHSEVYADRRDAEHAISLIRHGAGAMATREVRAE